MLVCRFNHDLLQAVLIRLAFTKAGQLPTTGAGESRVSRPSGDNSHGDGTRWLPRASDRALAETQYTTIEVPLRTAQPETVSVGCIAAAAGTAQPAEPVARITAGAFADASRRHDGLLPVDREPWCDHRALDKLLFSGRIDSLAIELGLPLSETNAQPVGELVGGSQIEQATVDEIVFGVYGECGREQMATEFKPTPIEGKVGIARARRAGKIILCDLGIGPARLQADAEPQEIVAGPIVELQALVTVREPVRRGLFR